MTYNAQQLAHIMKNEILYVDLNQDRFNLTWDEFVKVGKLMIDSGLSRDYLEGVVHLAELQTHIDAEIATPKNSDPVVHMNQLIRNTPKLDYGRFEKAIYELRGCDPL